MILHGVCRTWKRCYSRAKDLRHGDVYLRLGLTVVIDHLSGRVVWAGKERKAKTLLRFFRKLGPQRAAELEAVSMDMWEPYITVVGKKAPQARVIFDRFRIVKHLNEAVDKTRRELVRELKGTARRNLKNTKFPLLKAKHNRSAKDKRALREQVRANPNRKIFEARKRETAALGAGEKLVLGHPLAATIGDSARCMQNLEKVLFTGPKTSDTVTFICD